MATNESNKSANGHTPTFSRLPTNVQPTCYVLTLEPDLVNHTFTGTEQVAVEVKQSTDTVVLNSLYLEITEASYESSNGSKTPSKEVTFAPEVEKVTITFPSELKPGTGTLHIAFKGTLNDTMKGFYRAKYPSTDGSTPDRYVATTQFESTYARFAFPCWDEPAIKATFKVTLVAPKDTLALSNMPEVSRTEREDGKSAVVFDETPIMSTYLLAFIVGKFDHVETSTKTGVKVRAYTAPGKKEQGLFALDVAARSLDFYTEYFNTPYPLPKCDLVSISDFASGAMENWGLTTYRETAILVDPENTSVDRKQRIALVVAHEIAHQWFGNLVTMEWWTDLWLNEGFATFMEYLAVQSLIPEYKVWTQFVTSELRLALRLDGLKSSHPIQVPVSNPAEIDEIFDDISYAKGSAVIRMLHQFITDEVFRRGMSLYLSRFKYKNAQTQDLWAALQEASSKPVQDVMSTWTKQKGYPIVSVSETHDGTNRVIKLSQEKFASNGILPEDEKDYQWIVPISIVTSSDSPVQDILLSSRTSEVVIPNLQPGDWVKFNVGTVGVYRVQYSESMLQSLLPAVQSKKLPPLDRLNILDDLFALVGAGKVSTVHALKVIEAYKDDDDYVVWAAVCSCLAKLNSILSWTDFQEAYHEWGRRLLVNIHSKVGWEKKPDESHTDTLLRSLVLNMLIGFNDPAVFAEAKRLFEAHANKTMVIPADIRSSVYAAVAKQADEKLFSTMLRVSIMPFHYSQLTFFHSFPSFSASYTVKVIFPKKGPKFLAHSAWSRIQ